MDISSQRLLGLSQHEAWKREETFDKEPSEANRTTPGNNPSFALIPSVSDGQVSCSNVTFSVLGHTKESALTFIGLRLH